MGEADIANMPGGSGELRNAAPHDRAFYQEYFGLPILPDFA